MRLTNLLRHWVMAWPSSPCCTHSNDHSVFTLTATILWLSMKTRNTKLLKELHMLWSTLRGDFIAVDNQFYRTGCIPKAWKVPSITLNPKVSNPCKAGALQANKFMH